MTRIKDKELNEEQLQKLTLVLKKRKELIDGVSRKGLRMKDSSTPKRRKKLVQSGNGRVQCMTRRKQQQQAVFASYNSM